MLGEQKTVLLAIVGWYTKVSTQGCFLEEMAKDLSSGIATYLKSNLAENKYPGPMLRKPYYIEISGKTTEALKKSVIYA